MNDKNDLNKLSKKFILEKSPHSSRASDPARSFDRMLQNHSITDRNATITTYFDGIEELFVDLCSSHQIVVGAVAWLTNSPILSALSKPNHVAIVVQKEDFLRRDTGFSSYARQRRKTSSLYARLRPFDAGDFSETYPGQQEFHPQYNSTAQNWLFDNRGMYQNGGDAIRCLGFGIDPSGSIRPRMHHKFLVFGRSHPGLIMWPERVITGSFNLSNNAVRSRENVVLIQSSAVCQSYLSEWAQLWSMSEPLDWTSTEPNAERTFIGT